MSSVNARVTAIQVGTRGGTARAPSQGVAPEPTCTANFLDETFWQGQSGLIFNGGLSRWDIGVPAPIYGLVVASGWASGFEPTEMRITLSSPDAASFPFETIVSVNSEEGETLGTQTLQVTGPELKTLAIPLDFSGLEPFDGGITAIGVFNTPSSRGPYINCIDFIGGT